MEGRGKLNDADGELQFAVAVLANRRIGVSEALTMLGLFAVQLTTKFPAFESIHNEARIGVQRPDTEFLAPWTAPGSGGLDVLPKLNGVPYILGLSAGAAALLRSQGKFESQDRREIAREIKRRLMESVDLSPRLKCVSGGRLNLGRALGLGSS